MEFNFWNKTKIVQYLEFETLIQSISRNSEKIVALLNGYYHRFWEVLLRFSK